MNQDYHNVEHIIIDGCSSDNTINILKKYPHLIWVSEKDNGLSEAINKGIRMATGDIIAWINTDDYYEPNIFSHVVSNFEENPSVDILYGNVNVVDAAGRFLRKYPIEDYNLNKLLNHIPSTAACQGAFFRKRSFEKIGYFDENLKYTMDIEFLIRAGHQKLKIIHIKRTYANYRKHSEAKTIIAKKHGDDQYKEMLKTSRKYGGNYFNQMRFSHYRGTLSKIKARIFKKLNLV